MIKKIIMICAIITVLFTTVIVMAILADDFSQPVQPVIIEPQDKTVEDHKRLDRGEFTEEEIAEIKAEEKREDIEKEKFFEKLNQ